MDQSQFAVRNFSLSQEAIYKRDQRIEEVKDEALLELFKELNANDEQSDFPTLYTITKRVKFNEPLQMQISSLDYDGFIGRIGIGTLFHGTFSEGQEIIVVDDYDLKRKAKIKYLFVYHGLKRVAIKNSVAGDIVCGADGLDNDEEVRLTPPTILGVEKSLEFIATGESVAVTPQNVRMRKNY
ncbi:GTP-binding protein TypA/BipA like protein [Eufriesea mexicana]|uniref:GTP-binding protein TypA/BipA like protein n=1 Tax=Eufriesea mexicana TaxID=516756 RepID=A0A310SG54_9HYME|nr:GTP-binding protein TypA/BipA like protein [Eufriesea mexicana]